MPTAFLPDRAVLAVSGPDAQSFLQTLVTCDVDGLGVGDAAFGALLTPQGKILVDFVVVRGEDQLFYLDVDGTNAAALIKRLGMYKLRANVTIASTTKQILATWGGGGTPDDFVFRDPRAPALGERVILNVVDDPGDAAAYEAHRIALGVPKGGTDFPWGDTFPHEANMDWLGGISFTKGCYVGQEVVSRTQHRGTARRRILRVSFEGNAPPPGAEVRAGDTMLGTFGSAAAGQGLAAVRVDRLAEASRAGIPVTAGEQSVALVLPE